jgi:hypothetical protein
VAVAGLHAKRKKRPCPRGKVKKTLAIVACFGASRYQIEAFYSQQAILVFIWDIAFSLLSKSYSIQFSD